MFEKAIKKIEAKVDIQKGALRFREKFDNRCATLNMIFNVTNSNCLAQY